jgi:acyl carrier protein
MPGSHDAQFKLELKRLIVHACNKDRAPESIPDDEPLIGTGTALALDSLDVLQLNVAIQQHYGVRIDDGKHARRVMTSVNSLADFLRPA